MALFVRIAGLIGVGVMLASLSASGAEPSATEVAATQDSRTRLVYSTEFARKMVQAMQVDCKADDKRYLPLEDVLLARLARPLPEGFRLTMVAAKEKQSYRVQIVETLHNRDRIVDTRWRFAVTEDGGLDLNGIDPAEILKACTVSGDERLWKVPASNAAQATSSQ